MPDETLGPALRQLKHDLAARAGAQGGTPTFFDAWAARAIASIEREPEGAARGDLLRLGLLADRLGEGRYVDPAARLRPDAGPRREVDEWALVTSQGTLYSLEWKGVPLFKSIFDLGIYLVLLQELRPRTVVEIGSGLGASAVWLADMMRSLGVEAAIYSLDRRPPEVAAPSVEFRAGDCHAIEEAFSPAELASWPHPWLLIEDAHVNVAGVLRHFHPYGRPGDYLVVEDSGPKRDELLAFVTDTEAYVLDAKYADFFGRNMTSAADSILKRVR